jgi:glycosyltransferase involved in cell wall biosynthesis
MKEEYPIVTVIMPIRNEAGFIQKSLGSILAQDYPADKLQILVADGMSTDDTRAILRSQGGLFGDFDLIDNPGKIVPTGMNAALVKARGQVVVRVDGHCEIAPDYIRNCVRHLAENQVDGVGGPLETIGTTPLAKLIATAMSSSFGVGGSAFRTVRDQTMLTDTVAFPAYSIKAIKLAGPYDEEFVRNQDDEYNYRLRSLGAKILLASDVRAKYYSRASLASLWHQYYQYGFWKVRVMQKHPRQMQPRHFVPSLFLLTLIMGLLLTPFSLNAALLLGLAIATYLATSVAVSIRLAWRGAARELPRLRTLAFLPIIFATLHLSYGSGLLAGLVKFRNRWKSQPVDASTKQVEAQ